MKPVILLLGAALVALTSSASVIYPEEEYIQNVYGKGETGFENKPVVTQLSTTASPDDVDDDGDDDNDDGTDDFIEDFSDEEDADDDPGEILTIDEDAKIDGIQLKYLTPEEILDLLEDDDNMIVAELDIAVAKQALLDRIKGDTLSTGNSHGPLRRKRWIGPLISLIGRAAPHIVRGGSSVIRAARPLFRGSTLTKVNKRMTRRGELTTKQYNRGGGMDQARRDFDSFRVRNPKPVQGGTGQTGRVGNHDITVRPKSTEGSPTLSIRSPRPDGSTVVRKFRYPEN